MHDVLVDVLVIGGGPAGSTAATLLARRGFSVALRERERFPRFQIGESLLPFNNDLFDRLGVTDPLLAGDYFPKYGAEFATGDGHTDMTFRFDRNLDDERYHRSFQVTRSEFDHLLLQNAAASGVDVREEAAVTSVDVSDPSRAIVDCAGGERIEARFVIDASGHGTILGKRVGGKTDIEALKKVAVFAHYQGVARPSGRDAGNTLIVVLRNAWFWLSPITAAVMSVGLVCDRDHLKSCGLEPADLLARTIDATPYVAQRMHGSERISQVYVRRDFSYAMERMVGPNFALIGDAAGFLDPIFSTGVFMAMKSADIAASAVEARLRGGSMRKLRRYERDMSSALAKYLRFIENFYRREFLEVFMHPSARFGLIKPIVGLLAGNVFASRGDGFKLAIFFALVRLQKRFGKVAPRIAWERLPAPASV